MSVRTFLVTILGILLISGGFGTMIFGVMTTFVPGSVAMGTGIVACLLVMGFGALLMYHANMMDRHPRLGAMS